MISCRHRILRVTCTYSALLFAMPLYAQKSEAVRIPEIVVTAQLRAQPSFDVPISLVVLGSEKLDALQVNELKDFVAKIPDVTINSFPARPDTLRLFIRGVGQNDVSLTQDPSVGLYVDGIYVGTSVGAAFEFEDLERIEVLRGPQGSLYGRNTTGGAVNIITAKPDPKQVAARMSLGYANFDERRATAMLNLPVTDNLAIRLNGLMRKRDGLQENTGPGRDYAEVDHAALRAAIRFRPSERLLLDYVFEYSRNRDSNALTVPTSGSAISFPLAAPFLVSGTGGGATAQTSLINSFSVPSPFSPRRPKRAQALRPVVRNDGQLATHALTTTIGLADGLSLRSITGHRHIDNFQGADNLPVHEATIVTTVTASVIPQLPVGTVLSSIGPNGAAYNLDDIRFESTSEELQLLGDFGDRFNFVLGGYWYEDRSRQNIVGTAIGSGPLVLLNFTTARNRAFAAFGEASFHPAGDRGFGLTLGGRYSHDLRAATRINERSFSFAALGGFTAENCAFFALTFQALGQSCVPDGQVLAATYRRSFNNFSPSLTLSYKVDPALNFYVKYARGYKSGGTSQRSANPLNFASGFQPESISALEAGLKGSFLQDRLNIQFSAFTMRLKHLQASVQTGATAGDRDFIGLDGNRFRGVEFELNAALTHSLRLGLSGALLRARIGTRSATVLLDTGATQVELFIPDQTAAPKRSGMMDLEYSRAISEKWQFNLRTDMSYQSKAETSTNLADNRTIPGKVLADGYVSFSRKIAGGHELSIRLWGRNIFDKVYRTVNYGAFAFSGANTVSEFGEPRTYGATLALVW